MGDVIIVSGDIGVHGIAIMSVREGLEFGTQMITDSAALHPLVADMLDGRAQTCTCSATRPAVGSARR